MRRAEWFRRVGGGVILTACLTLVGGWSLFSQQRDILDAARLYGENQQVFEGIRKHYPGSFTEVRRIPEFDEAATRPENTAFLEKLRRSVPVEIVILTTLFRDGSDVIKVIIETYGLAVSGGVVGLVYFEHFVRGEVVEKGVEVFDSCDERALGWLETARERGYADVYCRINDHWYAYQSIT
ncbi:hypothetical protein [Pelagibius marinus]|uniref:hypothetical protein n=1 Tax=Pelagibius marinus TaxID=2762760 RepID=UPI001872F9BE|nr:hypothetical protein [Pelagibius marinus]